MDDDKNQPQAPSNSSTALDAGNLKKEMEPMPSSVDFSELSTTSENTAEPEPIIEDSSDSNDSVQNSQKIAEAKESVKIDDQVSPAASGKKYPMTKSQAQKIVKGPLLFKNSSDPMLWLALLMLRHYQWLERQKK